MHLFNPWTNVLILITIACIYHVKIVDGVEIIINSPYEGVIFSMVGVPPLEETQISIDILVKFTPEFLQTFNQSAAVLNICLKAINAEDFDHSTADEFDHSTLVEQCYDIPRKDIRNGIFEIKGRFAKYFNQVFFSLKLLISIKSGYLFGKALEVKVHKFIVSVILIDSHHSDNEENDTIFINTINENSVVLATKSSYFSLLHFAYDKISDNTNKIINKLWKVDNCMEKEISKDFEGDKVLFNVLSLFSKEISGVLQSLKNKKALGLTFDVGGEFGYGRLGLEIATEAHTLGIQTIPFRNINFDRFLLHENRNLLHSLLYAQSSVSAYKDYKITQNKKNLVEDEIYYPFSSFIPITILHATYANLQFGLVSKGLWGCKNVAMVTIERFEITSDFVLRASFYDAIFVSSSWNLQVMRMNGIKNVHLMLQGVHTDIFKPNAIEEKEKIDIVDKPFTIYSGGKLEFRKGQDIVLKSFIKWLEIYPNSHLIVNWENLWPNSAMDIIKSPHTQIKPKLSKDNASIDVQDWILAHGLPVNSFTVLPLIKPRDVNKWMLKSDVALFTNRAEGGTNLVAMEALSSGVPTILSANTGHLDLIYSLNSHIDMKRLGCYPLFNQREVKFEDEFFLGWGETSVDLVIESLKDVYQNPLEAKRRADFAVKIMQNSWEWRRQRKIFFEKMSQLNLVDNDS